MIDIPPLYFTLRVGFSCNNKCVHCFVERKKNVEDLTEEGLKATIDTIPPEATICFTGGEPTIRHDFLRLLQYSKSKGFINALQSNGIKFADKEFLKSTEPYLDSITLPIHSSDRDAFDKTTQIEGSYDQTMIAFRNLAESSICMTTQTVITQLNYKTLLDTFDMIQSVSPGVGMTLTFPHSTGAAHSVGVTPRLSEIGPYILPVLKKYGTLMHTHYIPRCYMHPYQNWVVNVDTHDDGSMWKPGTDFTSAGWEKLDYGVYQKDSKIKAETCKDCVFNDICIGIWKEYSELYSPLDLPPVLKDEGLPAPKEDARAYSPTKIPEIFLYRLSDKAAPYKVQLSPGSNRSRMTDKASGKIIEDRYALDSGKASLTTETKEFLLGTGADKRDTTVSVVDGVITAYNLSFNPKTYKLSPPDSRLLPTCTFIVFNLSAVSNQNDSLWYICDKVLDSEDPAKLEGVRNFFYENDKMLEYDNLMALAIEHQAHSFAISPNYNGDCWAYVF